MTRSTGKLQRLRDLGAEPALCDAFDADALRELVVAFQPEAVVNELTDLPDQGLRETMRMRECGVRARITCSLPRKRPERRTLSRRAFTGSYRAKRVQRSASSSGWYSAATASFALVRFSLHGRVRRRTKEIPDPLVCRQTLVVAERQESAKQRVDLPIR